MRRRQHPRRQVSRIGTDDVRSMLGQNMLRRRWKLLLRNSRRGAGYDDWRHRRTGWRRRLLWSKHQIRTVADYRRHRLADAVRHHRSGARRSRGTGRRQHLGSDDSLNRSLATGAEMTMCYVRLEIAMGQVRPMAAGHSVLRAAKRTDEHRAEGSLLDAYDTLTATTNNVGYLTSTPHNNLAVS